jgi:hypothetical protein
LVHEATPSIKATAGTINAFFIETPPKFWRTLIAWVKTLNISDERIYECWPFGARKLEAAEMPHPGVDGFNLFGLPVCAVHLAAQNLRHARSGDAKPVADLGERVTLPPHCCHLLASFAGVFRCKPV